MHTPKSSLFPNKFQCKYHSWLLFRHSPYHHLPYHFRQCSLLNIAFLRMLPLSRYNPHNIYNPHYYHHNHHNRNTPISSPVKKLSQTSNCAYKESTISRKTIPPKISQVTLITIPESDLFPRTLSGTDSHSNKPPDHIIPTWKRGSKQCRYRERSATESKTFMHRWCRSSNGPST